MTSIHAMPADFGLRKIIEAIPVIIVCTFVIRLSWGTELWWEVIGFVDMNPIIFILAWATLFYYIFVIAVGIVIIITKEKEKKTKLN